VEFFFFFFLKKIKIRIRMHLTFNRLSCCIFFFNIDKTFFFFLILAQTRTRWKASYEKLTSKLVFEHIAWSSLSDVFLLVVRRQITKMSHYISRSGFMSS